RGMAKRWASSVGPSKKNAETGDVSAGGLLGLAYPDRIAKNRGGGTGAFLLANGRGAQLDPASALAREPYLAVAAIVGSAAQARMGVGAAISAAQIEARFADRIEATEEITCDPQSLSLRGRRLRRLGALALAEQPVAVPADEAAARALAAGILKAGLAR